MAIKKIPIKNIKGQSGTQSQQSQATLSGGVVNIPNLSSLQRYAPGVASLLQSNLQQIQQVAPQQSGNVTSGNVLGMNWQVANLPFDTKLLVTQVPRTESTTSTEQYQETPLNYQDLIENQERIKKINEQLEQINQQRYFDYLNTISGIERKNNILQGLDEQYSNVFQKSFAPLTQTGSISYGYDPFGGLMTVRGAPSPPQFEKPLELKEIGKIYSGTKTTTKSGVDYSTQVLQSGTTSSSSLSSSTKKVPFNVQTVAGSVKKLGTEVYLKGLAMDDYIQDPNASKTSFIATSNSVLKELYNDPTFDLEKRQSINKIADLFNLNVTTQNGTKVDLSYIKNNSSIGKGYQFIQEYIGRRIEAEFDKNKNEWSPTAISWIKNMFGLNDPTSQISKQILAKASQDANKGKPEQRGMYFLGSLFNQLNQMYSKNPKNVITGIWSFAESFGGLAMDSNKISNLWSQFANKYEGLDQYKTAGANDLPAYLITTAIANIGK